jgi:hypothetical protein
MDMTRLKRNAERIRESAAKGIAKSLEGLPAWKPKHSEVGCTKGRLVRGSEGSRATKTARGSPRVSR